MLGIGVLKIVAVGSRVTCNPPPTDTDEDYLVLVGEDFTYETLFDAGFEIGGSEIVDPCEGYFDFFQSFKKEDSNVNYIITSEAKFFEDFVFASNIAKKLNLSEKQQRVNLFQIVLYDNYDADAEYDGEGFRVMFKGVDD